MKRIVVSIIIGLGFAGFFIGPSSAESVVRLPDPVAFSVKMELGDLALAESWLEAGLDPDFQGSRIGTGLMIGAWEGNLELMRLFISRGADINFLSRNGETALLMAAWQGKTEAVDWLIERGARINGGERQWSPLHYAVFSGHDEIAKKLIDLGADIDARSTNGSSVLMMAIYEGKEDLARMLIEKGADRKVANDWGDGALEWAMRNNNLKLARMVTSPEEFNIAVAQPKAKWGEPKRSLSMSKELEELLAMREKIVAQKLSTDAIDRRISAERVRIVRSQFDGARPVQRAATMEVTASRSKPQEQSAQIIYDAKGKASGFKAPPATYFGTPKMPVKGGKVKNY